METKHRAVQHILAAPQIRERTAPYVLEHDFDWSGLDSEATTMSGGERLLVRIARELWTAEKEIGLWELPDRLDVRNFQRVVDALRLYRGGASELVEAA